MSGVQTTHLLRMGQESLEHKTHNVLKLSTTSKPVGFPAALIDGSDDGFLHCLKPGRVAHIAVEAIATRSSLQ